MRGLLLSMAVRLRVPMKARPIDEPHRASSPLELLFDLTFVVAVAAATAQLAHGVADGHAHESVVPFLQVFFAIWWAWMNFTWFASSYDTDDVVYRLTTMVQMAGVLVLAAGVPAAATHSDYTWITVGYLVMRIGLVSQWIRSGIEDPERRGTSFRYAAGISIVQVGWVLRIAVFDSVSPWTFLFLVVLELLVPWWAERAAKTNWHPHHIAERYGLFVIIVLGESVLAATRAVQDAVEASHVSLDLIVVALCGLVLLFSIWWLYFLHPSGTGLADRRHRSYHWGYGHYGIFGALAALGAGLEVSVEQAGHHIEASETTVAYAVAIPVAVFLLLLHAVQTAISPDRITSRPAIVVCVALILLLPLATPTLTVTGTVATITALVVLLTAATITWPATATPSN
ncbi:low temperature requirement protein A [Kribbella sp. NPDC051620]|uniref:low temperature requirement protein A n=1 Tax=Kribbella sp. NPDC051620 TaxID=3364120 RepID=UPI0037AB5E99